MLSDEEKREMLEDSKSEDRRKAFALARSRVEKKPMTGAEYVQFLQWVQNLFSQKRAFKIIQGNAFKL